MQAASRQPAGSLRNDAAMAACQQHGAHARTSTSMSSSASAVYTRTKMICARVASSHVSDQQCSMPEECAARDSACMPTHVAQHGFRVQVVALRCPAEGGAASAMHVSWQDTCSSRKMRHAASQRHAHR